MNSLGACGSYHWVVYDGSLLLSEFSDIFCVLTGCVSNIPCRVNPGMLPERLSGVLAAFSPRPINEAQIAHPMEYEDYYYYYYSTTLTPLCRWEIRKSSWQLGSQVVPKLRN